MEESSSSLDIWIIVVATIATAIFTGGALVIAHFAYQYARTQGGENKPIRIAGPRPVGPLPAFAEESRYWQMQEREWPNWRVFDLYMRNRSALKQTVRIEHGSLWWPHSDGIKLVFRLNPYSEDFSFEPYEGGNVPLLARLHEHAEWPDSEVTESDNRVYKKRWLIRVQGMTASGQKVRFVGWVRSRYFKGVDTHLWY